MTTFGRMYIIVASIVCQETFTQTGTGTDHTLHTGRGRWNGTRIDNLQLM